MNVVDVLNDHQATPETLLEAMTTSVYEYSGDKTRAEMLDDLQGSIGSKKRIQELLASVEANPELVHEAALAWISTASEDPKGHDVLVEAVENSDRNAVLLEGAALAVIALYALYLIKTGGKSSTTEMVERKPNGSYIKTKKVVYQSFSTPLRALFDALGGTSAEGA
jgi:hypothetical protein